MFTAFRYLRSILGLLYYYYYCTWWCTSSHLQIPNSQCDQRTLSIKHINSCQKKKIKRSRSENQIGFNFKSSHSSMRLLCVLCCVKLWAVFIISFQFDQAICGNKKNKKRISLASVEQWWAEFSKKIIYQAINVIALLFSISIFLFFITRK